MTRSRPLLDGLSAEAGLVVGDNEPYDGPLGGRHRRPARHRQGLGERFDRIRQDLIESQEGAEAWAAQFARLLENARPPKGSAAARARWRPAPATACAATEDNGNKRMDDHTRTQLEAAAFRRLLAHLLSARSDVQNIDLMNLAGFCRNCLANWLKEAADERGMDLSKEESRTQIYAMPYETWKERHQSEASAEFQLKGFEELKPRH